MVGIRSPNGLVVGSCTSQPGVLGSIPKREEPGKTGRRPVLKYLVPHGSYSMGWWLGLFPGSSRQMSFICSRRNKKEEPSSIYTLRKVCTKRGCLEGLTLMISNSKPQNRAPPIVKELGSSRVLVTQRNDSDRHQRGSFWSDTN
jgi:hypothetical protein